MNILDSHLVCEASVFPAHPHSQVRPISFDWPSCQALTGERANLHTWGSPD